LTGTAGAGFWWLLRDVKDSIVTAFMHSIWAFCLYLGISGFVLVAALITISNFFWRKSLRDRLAEFKRNEFSTSEPRMGARP
jgi:apolipoprotein N-acyltransferase